QRRGLVMRCDGLYNTLKPLKETVRSIPFERRTDLNKKIKAITQDIRRLELQIVDIDTYLQLLLLSLPNLPHQTAPDGGDASVDTELRRWGEPLAFYFEPR